jgi:hypothetical protein
MSRSDAVRFEMPLRSVLVACRHQHTENAVLPRQRKGTAMFNIIEILANGSELIINSAPCGSESEAWADAHSLARKERQTGSTSTFTVRPA